MDDHEELLKRATIEANGWASAADRLPTSDPGHLGVLPEAAAIVRALSAALRAERAAHEATRRELARYRRTSDEWEGNAEDAMRDLETARAELAAERVLRRESQAWQEAKREWIDVATRTLALQEAKLAAARKQIAEARGLFTALLQHFVLRRHIPAIQWAYDRCNEALDALAPPETP